MASSWGNSWRGAPTRTPLFINWGAAWGNAWTRSTTTTNDSWGISWGTTTQVPEPATPAVQRVRDMIGGSGGGAKPAPRRPTAASRLETMDECMVLVGFDPVKAEQLFELIIDHDYLITS